MDETGAIEQKKDVEKGSDGVVKRWMLEIRAADKAEKFWRKSADEALKVFASDGNDEDFAKRKETFNILWANTETVRPALYNSLPRPDIRRRYRDKDPLGKAVAEVCERAITYTLDAQDFDDPMIAAVNDMLLPGRAVTRVRYVPSFNQIEKPEQPEGAELETNETEGNGQQDSDEPTEELAYEEVVYQSIQWDDFRRGPGKQWGQVPWIAFRHKLTKDDIAEKFPEFADVVGYDATVKDDEDQDDENDTDKNIFKRCVVWEVWDKEEKKVIFFSPSYKDKALLVEDDPLNLRDFYPIPRPLYAVESATSLVPATKFSMYETLAKELEQVTNRIRKILAGLRLRGIYDSRIGEMEKLFDAFDNSFVPAENVAALIESGGLDKAIWTLPLQMYSDVLMRLYEYRQGLIQQIYEITGISDIIRGATNPNETLGAQEIKANFGSQRLQREQREVQRYARDLIRISVELIAEKFDLDTIRLMTGLKFPTNEEKMMAQQQMAIQQQQAQQQYQQQAMMAQQQGQQPPPAPQMPPPDPKIMKMLQTPSWEDIQGVMQNDMMRDFRVDIETDSTVQAQQQADQKNITELLKGITDFMNGAAGPVQSGILTVDAAKAMLLSAVRRFKLGREVEDALEDIEAPKGPQGVPQEEVQKQIQQVQQQAEQKAKQAIQEATQKAKEAEQKAMGMAKEAEQRAMQQLKDAERRLAETEQKLKDESATLTRGVQNEVATEKARNKITESAMMLKYDRRIFDLEKELFAQTQANENKHYDANLRAATTIYTSERSKADAESSSHEAKENETRKQNTPVKIEGVDQVVDMLGGLFKSKEDSLNKIIEGLNKPRTVQRGDDGEITGIE